MRRWLVATAWLALLALGMAPHSTAAAGQRPEGGAPLSPYWGPEIQRWAGPIDALSQTYGFHPDFIAAVIHEDMRAGQQGVRRRSQAGLLNLLPVGAAWPSSAEMMIGPANELRWGMVVLSYAVQQSGGDLYTALAAYRGGWQSVGSRPAADYAAGVLDSFARALLARDGLSPEAATRWTVAVAIRAGNVPEEPLLVLGHKPIGPLHTLAAHTVYAFADSAGQVHYISGYVVPVGLSEGVAGDSGRGDTLEAPLLARLGDKDAAGGAGNPRVLLACLAQLERLRGRVTTRWFAPSGCPAAER